MTAVLEVAGLRVQSSGVSSVGFLKSEGWRLTTAMEEMDALTTLLEGAEVDV